MPSRDRSLKDVMFESLLERAMRKMKNAGIRWVGRREERADMLDELIVPGENGVKSKSSSIRRRTGVRLFCVVRFGCRTRHQFGEFPVELLRVKVVLNFHFALAEMRASRVGPDQRIAVGRAVVR